MTEPDGNVVLLRAGEKHVKSAVVTAREALSIMISIATSARDSEAAQAATRAIAEINDLARERGWDV